MPKVSVIIPTYNRAEFLKKAIDSVLGQSYQDFELIIIDNGSTDGTKDLVNSYAFPVLKYIYQLNRGPSCARNCGIKESQGEYIAFLDSDDCWSANKIKEQLELMQNESECLISHTQEIWYRNGKILGQQLKHKKYSGYIFDKCLPLCAVGMSTVMVKRDLFDEVGLFDENLPCCEDYDLWLRVSYAYPFLLVDKPLTLKDGGRLDQVSRRYAQGMDRFRIYSLKKILESGKLNVQQYNLVIEELKKKCRIYGNGCIKYGKKEEGQDILRLIDKYVLA